MIRSICNISIFTFSLAVWMLITKFLYFLKLAIVEYAAKKVLIISRG